VRRRDGLDGELAHAEIAVAEQRQQQRVGVGGADARQAGRQGDADLLARIARGSLEQRHGARIRDVARGHDRAGGAPRFGIL
jgi:hypothetical protein